MTWVAVESTWIDNQEAIEVDTAAVLEVGTAEVETAAASVIVTGCVAIKAISSVKDAASLWLQGIKLLVQGDHLTDWWIHTYLIAAKSLVEE